MAKYVKSTGMCRRQALLAHFGEKRARGWCGGVTGRACPLVPFPPQLPAVMSLPRNHWQSSPLNTSNLRVPTRPFPTPIASCHVPETAGSHLY